MRKLFFILSIFLIGDVSLFGGEFKVGLGGGMSYTRKHPGRVGNEKGFYPTASLNFDYLFLDYFGLRVESTALLVHEPFLLSLQAILRKELGSWVPSIRIGPGFMMGASQIAVGGRFALVLGGGLEYRINQLVGIEANYSFGWDSNSYSRTTHSVFAGPELHF